MGCAAFMLNVSAGASVLLDGMKGVCAWRGEMAESTGVWPLAPGYFASGQDLYLQPELGFVNAHILKLSSGRTGNLQCFTVGWGRVWYHLSLIFCSLLGFVLGLK